VAGDAARMAGVPYGAHGWLAPALDQLAKDRLVAFPTETVWGLAVRADSPRAVERMRRWKGRDRDQPVSVLVAGPESLAGLGASLGVAARRLVHEFWPGPFAAALIRWPRSWRGPRSGTDSDR
jgi:L-threonylcarbamoyladenylate synthase